MCDKIRFGIIGAGMIGKKHAEAMSMVDNIRLAAVCDVHPQAVDELKKEYGCAGYTSLDELLRSPDVDAVSICTPSASHGDIALKAARAGKHVVIEKPIDVSVEKADQVLATCKENGVICSVISQHRFDAAVKALKQAVDENLLGRLLYGACHTKWYRDLNYYKGSNWRGLWAFDGGGALINQSIHYIDLLLYIMGDVREVYGNCATLRHPIEVEDTGVATLKFDNGGIGLIHGTTIAYPGIGAYLEIYGENGTVVIKDDEIELWHINGDGRSANSFPRVGHATGSGAAAAFAIGSHVEQFKDVADAIMNGREPLAAGKDGRRVLALIKAIYQSSAENKPILLCGE